MFEQFKKYTAYLLSISLTFYPMAPYADQMSSAGADGQKYGQEIADQFSGNVGMSDGKMTLPGVKDGVFSDSGDSIDLNSLFPGASPTGVSKAEMAPGGMDVNELQSISEDAEEVEKFGKEYQSILFKDAQKAEPTMTGAAYKLMIDMANKQDGDLSNDPIFNTTKNIFDNVDDITDEFGSCSTSTTLNKVSRTEHIADYKTCERITDKSRQCAINHTVDAGLIQHHSGPYNFRQLSRSRIQLWIGQVGDNYLRGYCSVYEKNTTYKIINPQAITKAWINHVAYDDYLQIWVGPLGRETKVFNGPNGNFPPETGGACELGKSFSYGVNINVTNYLRSVAPGTIINFKTRVSVAGAGEGFASMYIDYNPNNLRVVESYTPQHCLTAASEIKGEFITGSVSCSVLSPTAARTGCEIINGVNVCQGSLKTPPVGLRHLNKLCKQYSVDVDYDFYKGDFCFIDAKGENVCFKAGTTTNTCPKYEADPKCGFINRKCLDGAQAADGTCYIQEEVWDCGEDIIVDDLETNTEIDCAGPVRCMGADCITPKTEQSGSFAKTAALLNAAQFMGQDMDCPKPDGTKDVICNVFGGKPFDCKKAVGGVQDCCDVPTKTTAGTYIQALFHMAKLDSSLMALNNGNAVKGAYQTLREPIAKSVSTVTKPFTSYIENIKGSVKDFFEPVTDVIKGLKDKVKNAISKTIKKMIGKTAEDIGTEAAGSAATDATTDAVTEEAGSQIVQNGAAAANVLMGAYTAYMLAVMVIQIIYKCEEKEFELAAKKSTKSCHFVGSYCKKKVLGACLEKRSSYCCFNSPLSRIVNSQVRPQIGRPFGDPRNPDCGGLAMTELSTLDWSKIDLGEWTALLTKHNISPNIDGLTMDSLTGEGSVFNEVEDGRANAIDRTQERFEGLDIDESRIEAGNGTAIDFDGEEGAYSGGN